MGLDEYMRARIVGVCDCPSCRALRQQQAPGFETFEPESAQPEPVYTHVLIDCYDDGDMMGDSAEPHTAESLLEAIAIRRDQEGRFKVYKLGDLILDVGE